MEKIKNDQKISSIKMYKKIRNYCPLGKSFYTNEFGIAFMPKDVFMDYIEFDNKINELENKKYIIEDVGFNIVEILKEFKPSHICVTSKVKDANHLEVEVQKEWSYHE